MNTPIYDFVKRYADGDNVRLHMPGHKGAGTLGFEKYDITEIDGADSLYTASGIIRESEQNAASLFGAAATLYSTEGSSLCIRAMLALACLTFSEKSGAKPAVIAGRNAHKAFLTAAALLDFEIVWLYPESENYSLCRCDSSASQLKAALARTPNAAAVYLTSPDYLGNTADIAAFARTAHDHGVPLLVDNAHGAYLRFLNPSRHPLDCGADLCCDSAHKTLPVLTGGAYLHISSAAPHSFQEKAKATMALFGSTSPSYLILQSLDLANACLADDYSDRLAAVVAKLAALKARLAERGWRFIGDEPLKITLDTKNYGYRGTELADCLKQNGIFCEYADPDYLVLMATPDNTDAALARLESVLARIPQRAALCDAPPAFCPPESVCSVRQALFAPGKRIRTEQAVGKICASLSTSCPPAVSPVVPGERISEAAVQTLAYYAINEIDVL